MACETILLVEDDLVQRTLLQRLLVKQGYGVLEACDGAEALGIYERHDGPIDLVITDVVMPRMMDGPELAERLLMLHPTLKILYISIYTDGAMVQSLSGDANNFLSKPLTPNVLYDKVRELLG